LPPGQLLFVVVNRDGFQVLGFEYLTAIQTFHVVHAVPTGDDLGPLMLTGWGHRNQFVTNYF